MRRFTRLHEVASAQRALPSRIVFTALAIAGVSAGTSLATAVRADAATLKVTTTTDELATGDGSCSLREAIFAVDFPGSVTDCGVADKKSNTIVLGAKQYGLSIGPFSGDDDTTGDLNVTGQTTLTISGSGESATIIDANGLDRVLSVGSSATVTLRRLTVTGGHGRGGKNGSPGDPNLSCSAGGAGRRGTDAGGIGRGGGISNHGALTLSHVAVIGNTAGAGGNGGAGASESVGCAGGGGGDGGGGGGIYNQGTLIVTRSRISHNKAGAGAVGGDGGNSTNNGSPGAGGGPGGDGTTGGGIYNNGGSARLTVTTSTLADNRAGTGGTGGTGGVNTSGLGSSGNGGSGGSGEVGGGIANRLGTVTVSRSTLVGDAAGSGGRGGTGGSGGRGGDGSWGGAISSIGGAVRVTNSTLVNDVAGRGGNGGTGAIDGGDGGTGGNGGAIRITDGTSVLWNTTIAHDLVGLGGKGASGGMNPGVNGAEGVGGGLFVQSSTTADKMLVQNTIVASTSNGANCSGEFANGLHNLSFGDTTCPGGRGNPMLGQLRNNGGPTKTMALGTGSAAIDRVPRAKCPAVDQRGIARPDPHEDRCDIGACARQD